METTKTTIHPPAQLVAVYNQQQSTFPDSLNGVEYNDHLYFFDKTAERVCSIYMWPLERCGTTVWCIIPKAEQNNLAVILESKNLCMAIVKEETHCGIFNSYHTTINL